MWTEIDIGTTLGNDDLKRAFAATFGITPSLVRVTDDIASLQVATDPGAVVVEQRLQPGEFPQRLLIVLNTPELARRVGAQETSIESYAMLSLLSANMKTSILAADRQNDPYAALLIQSDGNAFHVDLDQDFLDDTGGIRLVPMTRVPDSNLSHLVLRQSLVS